MAWSGHLLLFRTYSATFVSRLSIVVSGTGSPAIDWTLYYDRERNAVGTVIGTGTADSVNLGDDEFFSIELPPNRFVWVEFAESAGTFDRIEFSMLTRRSSTTDPYAYTVETFYRDEGAEVSSGISLPILLNMS